MNRRPVTPGMYGWKVFLYFGVSNNERMLLHWESEKLSLEAVLAEVQIWLTNSPNFVTTNEKVINVKAILFVEAERG
jgi:hypothetical protein